MRRKRHKFKVGDIFKVYLGDGLFGYALIILKFEDIRKQNIIPEFHPLNNLMTVPILVRTYNLVTDNENITLDYLLNIPYKNTLIIMDDLVLYGNYPIILHKEIEEDDIDFPLFYGVQSKSCKHFPHHHSMEYHFKNNPNESIEAFFSWGFGIVRISNNDLKNNLPNFDATIHMPQVRANLYKDVFKEYYLNGFIFDKKMKNELSKVYKYFKIPENIMFDEFNRIHNGLTKKEIISLIK